MTNNHAILERCKYYDEIVSTGYDKDDYITEKLISSYRDYVWHAQNINEEMITIDAILYEYISSKPFYQYVQNYYLKENIQTFEEINSLIQLRQNYIEKELMMQKKTKWI